MYWVQLKDILNLAKSNSNKDMITLRARKKWKSYSPHIFYNLRKKNIFNIQQRTYIFILTWCLFVFQMITECTKQAYCEYRVIIKVQNAYQEWPAPPNTTKMQTLKESIDLHDKKLKKGDITNNKKGNLKGYRIGAVRYL